MSNAEALFARHQPGVLRYLTRVVGHRDAASDLTQEVFLRVSRSAVPRAEADQLRGWVFRIARNLALNHLRDRARHGETVMLADSGQSANQEVAAAIREALARLPDLDRDVFLLRESAGLSYAEIAAACETSTDAVRARLHRARVQLREALAGPVDCQRAAGIRFVNRGRL